MKWAFQNRILLKDKTLISDNDDERPLETGDHDVVLRIDGRDGNALINALVVKGERYENADAAVSAGRMWRQRLAVAFANVGVAADFDDPPITLRTAGDIPADSQMPGLLVNPIDGAARIEIRVSGRSKRPLDTVVSSDLPRAIDNVRSGLDRQVELAYALVHQALAASNPEVKFILWISAIEALVPDDLPEKVDDDTVTYLNALIDEVRESRRYNGKVRGRVVNALRKGKKQTITDFGASLARGVPGTYDGKSPEDFFRENYPVRSALVHGNADPKIRPSREEIQRRLPELEQFALRMLHKEVRCGGQGG